jgi:hypothetical protein
MSAPDPLSIIDLYIETCERALPVEEEMAATAPPEREESAQERLDRMQAALAEAKEARAALEEFVDAARALHKAVVDETAALEAMRRNFGAGEAKAAESRVMECSKQFLIASERLGGAA